MKTLLLLFVISTLTFTSLAAEPSFDLKFSKDLKYDGIYMQKNFLSDANVEKCQKTLVVRQSYYRNTHFVNNNISMLNNKSKRKAVVYSLIIGGAVMGSIGYAIMPSTAGKALFAVGTVSLVVGLFIPV
ncbi:MAG: hypothetical protein ACOCWC_04350 [Bacteroidota bacterium]